jgi:hypothetical protein
MADGQRQLLFVGQPAAAETTSAAACCGSAGGIYAKQPPSRDSLCSSAFAKKHNLDDLC